MAKGKDKSGRLSVFKGREAKLNRAIFHILALKSPLTIYEISKEAKTERHLKHTKYTNVNRRVRILEEDGYLEKAGTRKTQAGFQVVLYQLSARGYLAIMLNQTDIETVLREADNTTILTVLAALASNYSARENPEDESIMV